MKRLREEETSKITASSSIPSFHSIVEELVLNAIDARATRIDITVDLSEFSVEVRDNGEGVVSSEDSHMNIGEWHHSSKSWSAQDQNGFKGQALASIRHIARRLEITSRAAKSRTVLFKSMTANHTETKLLPISSGLIDTHGTIVRVIGVFEDFAVRRKCIRAESELMSLQEFIHHMGVLHHDVAWSLSDATTVPPRTLIAMNGVKSVSKRIIALHGLGTLSRLQAFSFTDGRYSLEGLLSPPTRSDCAITRTCQYLYVNQRWMRNKDEISKLINQVYAKSLADTLNYGPSAKHVKTQLAKFPHFVLKFSCQTSDCDILVEPSKTVVLFRDAEGVREFVRKALLAFSARRFARFEDVLSDPASLSNEPSRAVCAPPVSAMLTSSHSLHWEDFFPKPTSTAERHADNTPARNLFSAAFLWPEEHRETVDDEQTRPAIDRNRRGAIEVTVQRLPSFGDVFEGRRDERTAAALPASLSLSPLPSHSRAIDLFHAVAEPLSEFSGAGESSLSSLPVSLALDSVAPAEDSLSTLEELHAEYCENDTVDSYSAKKAVAGDVVFHSASNARTVRSSVDYLERIKFPPRSPPRRAAALPITLSVNEQVQVDREMLSNLRIVGQFASKFIVCTHGSLLLLFDQHAVDERIRFEVALENLQSACVATRLTEIHETQCTAAERSIYLQKKDIFQEWGFDYDISALFLTIRSTPTFLNEQLTVADMQEFNHFLFENMRVPKARLIPPALLRIAACRACRSSVKFGTNLTHDEMGRLLGDLVTTKLPFQCAHGRPSVFPVVQLKSQHLLAPKKCPRFETLPNLSFFPK